MSADGDYKILVSEATVDLAVRPQVPGERPLFGTVVEVVADSPFPGWTTLYIQGYDRWDRSAVGHFQYRPGAKILRTRGLND